MVSAVPPVTFQESIDDVLRVRVLIVINRRDRCDFRAFFHALSPFFIGILLFIFLPVS